MAAAKNKRMGRAPRAAGSPIGYSMNFYPKERAMLKKIAKKLGISEAATIRMLIEKQYSKM